MATKWVFFILYYSKRDELKLFTKSLSVFGVLIMRGLGNLAFNPFVIANNLAKWPVSTEKPIEGSLLL